MTTFDPAPTFDELLQHADWVRRLARELVLDESRAEDVVQETWIAALERPPADRSNVRGWLAAVARNVARGIGRSEGRRGLREQAAARAEALASTAEIAERASLQRDLVDRVLALDEPYRSVLLLRYFEDLELRAIARRLGVPVSTVRTRHARGLEKLRAKLDREYGDRASWGVALVELARRADAPTAVATAAVLGGLVKSKLAFLVAALIVAIGAVWWRSGSRDSSPPVPALTTLDAGDTPVPSATAPLQEVDVAGERIGLTATDGPNRPPDEPAVTATAQGRTVDVLGQPVAGVEIKQATFHVPFRTLEQLEQHRAPAARGEHGGAPDDPLLARLEALPTVSSDEHGVFTYAADADVASLLVWQRGRTLVGGGWRVLPSGGEELVLVVASTRTLAGTVAYEDGTPARAASIQGRSSIEALSAFPWSLRRSFDGPDDVGGVSDVQGRFALAGAPVLRELALGAVADGPARSRMVRPFETTTEPGVVELVVVRDEDRHRVEVAVTGRVVDAGGAGAPDVEVRLGNKETRSGQDGSFRLVLGRGADEALVLRAFENPRFRYDLSAVRPGFQPAILEGFGRDLASGAERDGVLLQLGAETLSITGRVVGAQGEPLAGIEIELLDPAFVGMGSLTLEDLARTTRARGMRARRFLTDERGQFDVDGLSRRSYRLLAIGVEARVVFESEPIAAGSRDVLLREALGSVHARVEGRVVSRGGAAVAGVEVALDLGWQTDWGIAFRKRAQTVVSDSEGRFVLERVPKRLACLSVLGARSGQQVLDTADIVEGAGVELVANLRARLRVELRANDVADGFEVRDGDDRTLSTTRILLDGGSALHDRVPIQNGASDVCEVEDTARTLVLFAGAAEVRRVPLDLSVDELRVVVP